MQALPVNGDVSVREALTAGGLLGFTTADMFPEVIRATRLTKGGEYTGVVTGMLRGRRVEHMVSFTASRDQELEPFVRGRANTPDQDRVFVVHPHGSAPMLFVAGTIRPAEVSA